MNTNENLRNQEAIDKLKGLVEDIMVCLFCTDLKIDDGSTCRPMTALKVCEQGNIWFFSEKNSDKNKAIAKDKNVQLFFSHPAKSSYLVVNGEASIVLDKTIIDELWTPAAKIWFKDGKEDSNISIIKVKPTNAYYWDTDGSKMVNFIKLVASIVSGKNLVSDKQGELKI
jgi:general stress protein 26